MYLTEPDSILMNFLRSKVAELTRSSPSLSNRQVTDSQTFAGTGSQTDYILDNNPICINSITVGGTAQVPYQDYGIDLDNKTIKFDVAPTNTAVIIVNYDKLNTSASNWINPDKPREDLSRNSYPRIGITNISYISNFKEMGQTTTINGLSFQFDILTYKRLFCTIGTENKEGEDINRYLARQIIKAFKTYWSTDLIHKILDWNILDNSPAPFEPNKNVFRRILQMSITFRNLEEET